MRTKKVRALEAENAELLAEVLDLRKVCAAAEEALAMADSILTGFQKHDKELHDRIDLLEKNAGGSRPHGGQYL